MDIPEHSNGDGAPVAVVNDIDMDVSSQGSPQLAPKSMESSAIDVLQNLEMPTSTVPIDDLMLDEMLNTGNIQPVTESEEFWEATDHEAHDVPFVDLPEQINPPLTRSESVSTEGFVEVRPVLEEIDDVMLIPLTVTDLNTLDTSEMMLEDAFKLLKTPGRAPLWLDLVDPAESVLLQIQKVAQIHALTVEDCVMRGVREKVEPYASYLFIVFRALSAAVSMRSDDEMSGNDDDDNDSTLSGSSAATSWMRVLRRLDGHGVHSRNINLLLFSDMIITMHSQSESTVIGETRRRLFTFWKKVQDRLSEATESESAPVSPNLHPNPAPHKHYGSQYPTLFAGAASPSTSPNVSLCRPDWVMYQLLDVITDAYSHAVGSLLIAADRLDENAVQGLGESTDESKAVLLEIAKVRRLLADLRRSIVPKRKVLSALLSKQYGLISNFAQIYLRDVADHLSGLEESVNTGREILSNALSVQLALISLRSADTNNDIQLTVRRMTGIAILLAPATLVSSIFGMNVPLPFQSQAWTTGFVFLLMLYVTYLAALVFRVLKWV